jgi:hypothetical protein
MHGTLGIAVERLEFDLDPATRSLRAVIQKTYAARKRD